MESHKTLIAQTSKATNKRLIMAAHSKNQNTIATPIISSNSFKLSSFTSLPIFGCPLVSSPASVLQQLHMLLKLILGYKMLFF